MRAIEAVRAAVGADIHLMADFNQGLDVAEALIRCQLIDALGLDWIEEPIVYDNLDGYALLSSKLKTPLQLGENFYGPRELHRAIQMKACDLVMPDFMRIGGVTGWLRSAAIAAASGVPISTHLYPEVGAHVMRVSETSHWLEWQNWVNPILKQPYDVADAKERNQRADRAAGKFPAQERVLSSYHRKATSHAGLLCFRHVRTLHAASFLGRTPRPCRLDRSAGNPRATTSPPRPG